MEPTFSIIKVNNTTTWVIKIPAVLGNISLLTSLAILFRRLGFSVLFTDIMNRSGINATQMGGTPTTTVRGIRADMSTIQARVRKLNNPPDTHE